MQTLPSCTAMAGEAREPPSHTLTPVKADSQLGPLLYIHMHEFSFSFVDFAIGTKGRMTSQEIKSGEFEITFFFFCFH